MSRVLWERALWLVERAPRDICWAKNPAGWWAGWCAAVWASRVSQDRRDRGEAQRTRGSSRGLQQLRNVRAQMGKGVRREVFRGAGAAERTKRGSAGFPSALGTRALRARPSEPCQGPRRAGSPAGAEGARGRSRRPSEGCGARGSPPGAGPAPLTGKQTGGGSSPSRSAPPRRGAGAGRAQHAGGLRWRRRAGRGRCRWWTRSSAPTPWSGARWRAGTASWPAAPTTSARPPR